VEPLVATLAPGQRVVSMIDAPALRANALTHIVDRLCVGRCFSYANYEPSTAQFRVRAVAQNPMAAATFGDSWAMQTGAYTVKPEDLPFHVITLDSAGNPKINSIPAGETPKLSPMNPW